MYQIRFPAFLRSFVFAGEGQEAFFILPYYSLLLQLKMD